MPGFTSFGLLHFLLSRGFRRNAAWTEKELADSTDCIFIMRRQKGAGHSFADLLKEGLMIRVTATVRRERKGEEVRATVHGSLTEHPTALPSHEGGPRRHWRVALKECLS